MPNFDLVVECPVQRSPRTQQLEGMFDVPPAEKLRLEWRVEMPIEEQDWTVGCIVGPSGCGKTLIARRAFGSAVDRRLRWGKRAVVDEFAGKLSMQAITQVCSAVGFNTIPSWMKPFQVLSNGERFRVELARRLLEGGALVVVDEFTSVVDRQVAKITSHAVQKYVRKKVQGQQFVAVTCHYDVIDWLQPDWVYDPSRRSFARRCLQPRPRLHITISPVPYAAWEIFAPFHYLTAELHKSARCFGLFVGDTLTSFVGLLYRPINVPGAQPIMGISRGVTLPDYQGLGLIFVLGDRIAALYKAIGWRVHAYPAHPSFIRSMDRSTAWTLRKRPGRFSGPSGRHAQMGYRGNSRRPCAVFRYAGPAAELDEARRVFEYWPGHVDCG